MPELFSIKIVGPAGAGVLSAGETLIKSFVGLGYYALGYPEYPSLIKGGHNTYLITVSDKPFPNNAPRVDVLIALTQTALNNEHKNITDQTRVIVDLSTKPDHEYHKLYQVGLIEIAKNAGNPLSLNTAAIGFVSNQLKFDPEFVWKIMSAQFGAKSQTLLDQNKLAFDKANEVSKQFDLGLKLPSPNNKDHRLIMTGSEGVGLGAIAAGLNLYVAYPMTPSSPVLHFLANHQTEFNYLVRQSEDELSAINLAIGASFAGAKAMTGSSGGGFALMEEGISLSGMLEVPLVVYLAMRPGPATGLPTWTSQSDLLFAINSGHGEFPKIVLAPSDPLDSYLLTHSAFNLSQTYHCPVIILSDKYLAENNYSLGELPDLEPVSLSAISPDQKADEMFSRYQYSPDGIHGRTLPGMPGGEYIANSDEHDSVGLVDETAENRNSNNQRRQNKFNLIKKNIPLPEIFGDAERAVITWGSHKFIGRQVAEATKATHIHFSYLWPLPNGLEELLAKYTHTTCIENNTTHQLARLLRQETGHRVTLSLGDDSGRPLDSEKLIDQIKHG